MSENRYVNHPFSADMVVDICRHVLFESYRMSIGMKPCSCEVCSRMRGEKIPDQEVMRRFLGLPTDEAGRALMDALRRFPGD